MASRKPYCVAAAQRLVQSHCSFLPATPFFVTKVWMQCKKTAQKYGLHKGREDGAAPTKRWIKTMISNISMGTVALGWFCLCLTVDISQGKTLSRGLMWQINYLITPINKEPRLRRGLIRVLCILLKAFFTIAMIIGALKKCNQTFLIVLIYKDKHSFHPGK